MVFCGVGAFYLFISRNISLYRGYTKIWMLCVNRWLSMEPLKPLCPLGIPIHPNWLLHSVNDSFLGILENLLLCNYGRWVVFTNADNILNLFTGIIFLQKLIILLFYFISILIKYVSLAIFLFSILFTIWMSLLFLNKCMFVYYNSVAQFSVLETTTIPHNIRQVSGCNNTAVCCIGMSVEFF